jgi:hypothetical protein
MVACINLSFALFVCGALRIQRGASRFWALSPLDAASGGGGLHSLDRRGALATSAGGVACAALAASVGLLRPNPAAAEDKNGTSRNRSAVSPFSTRTYSTLLGEEKTID